MNELTVLARDLDVSVWTLRRAIATGLIRARRPGPRKVELDSAEISYLVRSWKLISNLRATLRTEPTVRLAVLFGSEARGSARADSDVDVLVELSDMSRLAEIEARLSEATDRLVSLSLLGDVARNAPILDEILRDGRVLVDRGETWRSLRANRSPTAMSAVRERRRMQRDARAALAELSAES